MTFTTHHLVFDALVQTPLELDDQAGSNIRGALVGGLRERFCANKAAQRCADCPLLGICPVAALIAPMRDSSETGGEQRPRPYVTRPPAGGCYQPGQSLQFGLALFGGPAALFPYLVLAAQAIETQGLGRRLVHNRGQRGQIQLTQIAAQQPLSGATQSLYQAGNGQVYTPGLPVGQAEVAAYAAQLPDNSLQLHFQTPLRLIEQKQLVKRFALRPFMQRLIERLNELGRAYGDGPLVADYLSPLEATQAVELADDRTRWVDVVSYSTRTRSRTPIGGLVGSVTLSGELAALRELLVWGSLIHVGKNAVKGDGWYFVQF